MEYKVEYKNFLKKYTNKSEIKELSVEIDDSIINKNFDKNLKFSFLESEFFKENIKNIDINIINYYNNRARTLSI